MIKNQRGWIPSLIALAGVVVLVAYAYVNSLGAGARALEAAREQWVTSSQKDYQYVVQVGCFCPADYVQPVEIRVKNGLFFGAEGRDLPVQANYIDDYGTVEALFAILEAAYEEGADEITAEYDATYGFPLHVSIDRVKAAVDDELSLTITNFQVLKVGE